MLGGGQVIQVLTKSQLNESRLDTLPENWSLPSDYDPRRPDVKSKFSEPSDHCDLKAVKPDAPLRTLSQTRDQQRDLQPVKVCYGNRAANIGRLPDLKAEDPRLEHCMQILSLENRAVETWASVILLAHRPHGQSSSELTLS
jgi:hypothetical protein